MKWIYHDVPYLGQEEHILFKVTTLCQVAPSLRRKGIGRELVTELLHRLPGAFSERVR